MHDETRLERRLSRWVARATSPRAAAIVIASVTTTITVAAAVLITVVDRDGFPSIASGLWWAVQTVTTVGYGDHVPETGAGRILAAIVMLLGIGFITVITASITGALVGRSQSARAEDDARLAERMRSIDERLARIERRLDGDS
jgi:voltage-gated potassium channel